MMYARGPQLKRSSLGRSSPYHSSREHSSMPKRLPRNMVDMRRDWALLSLYQRFETLVAFGLTAAVAAVVLAALYRLLFNILDTLVLRALNPLDHTVFQAVFGDILTVLIALEFNHTLQYLISRERGIINAKIVILIALLALARKVIIIDLHTTSPATVAALAALAIALAGAYHLVRESTLLVNTTRGAGHSRGASGAA